MSVIIVYFKGGFFMQEELLLTPGPTPIARRTYQAMSQGIFGHRTQRFKDLSASIQDRLKPIFGTDQDVVILTATGTSTLEAAMVNLVAPGDDIVIIVSGVFGEKFKIIAERYNYKVHIYDVEWGEAADPVKFKEFLSKLDSVQAVFTQACETSTSVLHPLKELGQVVQEYDQDTLFIVDAVSALGGADIHMERDGIDCLVTGSQKALMLPPGLGFVGINDKALDKINQGPETRYYLDLRMYLASLEEDYTPQTPAVTLYQGLDDVLDIIHEEGLENVYKRHIKMQKMLRAGLRALDLKPLVNDDAASPTVTAVSSSEEEIALIKDSLAQDYGISIAGGQKILAGKIVRIGHMGFMFPKDMLTILSALEAILSQSRQKDYYGKAIAAAQGAVK